MDFKIIEIPGSLPICIGGTINADIAKVMAAVKPVGKDGINNEQKYPFRKAEDLMNALHRCLSSQGVTIAPYKVETQEDVMVTTGTGKQKNKVALTVTYLLQASDGSFRFAQSRGAGEDYGDKASNKAMTFAFKYFIMETFVIPTKDMTDGDEETPAPTVDPLAVELSKATTPEQFAAVSAKMNTETLKTRYKDALRVNMQTHGVKYDKDTGKWSKA
jgi:hypothetical protein